MNTYRTPPLQDAPDAKPFNVSDPAIASAIAQCWLHRTKDMPASVQLNHLTCDWCSYPLDVLINSLNDFWRDEDSEYKERDFRQLAPQVQRRLVEKAAHE